MGSEEHNCEFMSDNWKHAMTHLYRVIFKAHLKYLHPLQREFGDGFIRSQFNLHKSIDERQALTFYKSWVDYVAQIESGVAGKDMSQDEIDLLSDDQKSKLNEIRRETIEIHRKGGAI
eukprot:GILJ01030235.1.p1 GENE.GILJ01030235.1~~GILJ01030235.1.p1  ORF type:complete len:118 (+),score=16.76 GILJ01030235.1:3-356(+)